jgi:redox-sensing transcriptional repressor
MELPKNTIRRLVELEQYLQYLHEKGISKVSSEGLGAFLGESAFTIRKDLNRLGETGTKGRGYTTSTLLKILSDFLWNSKKKACLIGLGKLGELLLQLQHYLFSDPVELVAGFDVNINKLETISSPVPLFPLYEIEDIIERKNIELAVVAVNNEALEDVIKLLSQTSIRGIINYCLVPISKSNIPHIEVQNVNLNKELKFLIAKTKFKL